MRFFIFAGLLFFLTLSATNVRAAEAAKSKPPLSFAFERNDADVKRLAASLVEIKMGATLEEVKRKMGRPDAETTVFKPQVFGKNTFLFTRLDYFLKKVDLETDNVKDHKISLYFDENSNVFRISRTPCVAANCRGMGPQRGTGSVPANVSGRYVVE